MTVKRKKGTQGLPAKVENAVKAGLILSGDLVAQRATRKAPVDTGRLKRSITRGNPFKTVKGWAIAIGSNVEYAPYIEWGTGDKSENPSMSKNPSRPGMRAQPYLRPAIRESKSEVVTILIKRVIGALTRL